MIQDGYIKWIRERVGHELIYIVFACVIVLDEAGRVLIQRRYEFDWPDLVGGAKEPTESLAACAVREVREECGLEVRVERLVGVYSDPTNIVTYPNGDRVQPWTALFVCRAIGGKLQPDGREILQATFYPLNEILPHPVPVFDRMLRDALLPPVPGMSMQAPQIFGEVRPFYPRMRELVGNAPLVLPGSLALIRDEAGRILMTRRQHFTGWDLPGGLADLGENATQTAIREVKEETGLDIRPLRALGIYSDPSMMYIRYPNGDEVYGVALLLEAEIIGGELQADGEENLEAAFIAPDEWASQIKSPLTRQILADIQQPEKQPYIR